MTYIILLLNRTRIETAISLREALLLPSKSTSVYRLINGEGDRLGGLIVDVIGNLVVVQSSAVWVELLKKDIFNTLAEFFTSEG